MRLQLAAILFALASTASADPFDAKDGWKEIAPSVYQRFNADGTIDRESVGEKGMAYEHARIRQRIEDLKWERNFWDADAQSSEQTIRDLESLLDMGKGTVVPPQVRASQSGYICSTLDYQFTNSLSVTSTSASLYGKTKLLIYDDFAPPSPPTSAYAGVHTTIYRHQQAPVDKVSGWGMTNPVATWEGPYLVISWTGVSSSATPQVRPYPFCTSAEVYHQVYAKGGACGAGDSHGWTKTYPSCYP